MSGEIPRLTTAATEAMVVRDGAETDLPAIRDIYNTAVAARTCTQAWRVTNTSERPGLLMM